MFRYGMLGRLLLFPLATVGLVVGTVVADTLRVPSEYPTIQAAVDVASSGDEILVAPGIYEERVTIDLSGLYLRSEINGGAVIRKDQAVVIANGDSCTISGFAMESTTSTVGSVVLSLNGEEFLVESCAIRGGNPSVGVSSNGVIRESSITAGKTGIQIIFGADLVVEASSFMGNTSMTGGGIMVQANPGGLSGSDLTLRDCYFVGNQATGAGGGVAIDGSLPPTHQLTLERCLFFENSAPLGAAVHVLRSDVELHSCTIARNTVMSSSVNGGVVDVDNSSSQALVVGRSIIAFNIGRAFRCTSVGGSISCSDVYGNESDALCGIDAGSNLSLDPMFCNLDEGDFTIDPASPCAPGQSPEGCGLIGMFPAACISAVEEATWGAIKHRSLRNREAKK